MAIRVTVRLFATLRRREGLGREGVCHVEVPGGTTVEGLIRQVGIEPGAQTSVQDGGTQD